MTRLLLQAFHRSSLRSVSGNPEKGSGLDVGVHSRWGPSSGTQDEVMDVFRVGPYLITRAADNEHWVWWSCGQLAVPVRWIE